MLLNLVVLSGAIWQEPKKEVVAIQVAVLPFYRQGGTESATKALETAAEELLKKADCSILDIKVVDEIWFGEMAQPKRKLKLSPKDYYYDLPLPKHLLEFGKKAHVQYVLAYRGKFSDDTVWQGLGPKTKAMVTLDWMLVDVEKERFAIDAKGVRSNGTVSQTAWRTAADVFLSSSALAILGGGAVTPLYQKGGLEALGIAFEPWLKARLSTPKS